MNRRTAPACFSPEEAASRRRVRRYAVPRHMIEQAAERRTAGDWRGACAAALADVDIDLAEITEQCGQDVSAALEDDLRHLVPDLLRWHLPRLLHGWTTLDTGRTVVLARYRPVRPDEGPRSTPYLYVDTPPMRQGPQRVTLRFGTLGDEGPAGIFGSTTDDWRYARHLWDARHTAELREHAGGPGRLPFFDAEGRPLAPDALPSSDPGPGDAAARAEWVTLLHERGEVRRGLRGGRDRRRPDGPGHRPPLVPQRSGGGRRQARARPHPPGARGPPAPRRGRRRPLPDLRRLAHVSPAGAHGHGSGAEGRGP
ncbi:hypothetical protein STENM223S_07279 [Streptomyces tendae]